jgi:hypothetical protein
LTKNFIGELLYRENFLTYGIAAGGSIPHGSGSAADTKTEVQHRFYNRVQQHAARRNQYAGFQTNFGKSHQRYAVHSMYLLVEYVLRNFVNPFSHRTKFYLYLVYGEVDSGFPSGNPVQHLIQALHH